MQIELNENQIKSLQNRINKIQSVVTLASENLETNISDFVTIEDRDLIADIARLYNSILNIRKIQPERNFTGDELN